MPTSGEGPGASAMRWDQRQGVHLQRCNAGAAVLLHALGSRLSLALRLAQPLLERLCGVPAALLPLLQAHQLLLQSPRPGRRLLSQTQVFLAHNLDIFCVQSQGLQSKVMGNID